jgi:flagellar protein FliS
MITSNPYNQYLDNQLKTATPGRLLVMTFDAAIKFAKAAAESMEAHKLDEQSANIRRVQNILMELMSTLNRKADSKLADSLYGLYSYMFDKLTQANIADDQQALAEVTGMLAEMRQTWADAEMVVRSGNPVSAAAEGQAI